MKARIYQPAKTAMQSGRGNTRHWLLEFEPEAQKSIDPVMGWVGSDDMRGQVTLKFETREEAEAYANRNRIPFAVLPAHKKRRRIQNYADNFK